MAGGVTHTHTHTQNIGTYTYSVFVHAPIHTYLSTYLLPSHTHTDISKSMTIPETGTIVTTFADTAESVATNGTKVILHGRDLWAEFHKCTTEMIITKEGRYGHHCVIYL